MRKILLFVALINLPAIAQEQSVLYSPEENKINRGRPLPSEEPFYIQGNLPEGIKRVELSIYKSKKNENLADGYSWKAAYQSEPKNYELFVAYPLRSNENYTLKFYYYILASDEEMLGLQEALQSNLASYVNANFIATKRGISALTNPKAMLTHLDQIVIQGLQNYTHPLTQEFLGFSDMVKIKLEQLKDVKLKGARFNLLSKNEDSNANGQAEYMNQLKNELIDLLHAEVDQYLRTSLLMLVDVRELKNYPTEKKPFYLPLNLGYAGTYFSGGFNDLDYGTSAFAGISVPLGNRSFTRFLGNASVSTGVFFSNMEDSNDTEISGPLIGRPVYIGLGYRMFRILRFNVGTVLTASDVNANIENITLYPFVGFSAEFNVWVGFNK
ncbi:hypothetical protein SAMN04488057_103325 [Cyclobacterium lianum]|uniref:Uncharacterized protein n=1 Tax=Cyclobacterium lianum TaxID=388280 RepID=A0A1M7LKS3_9BACT|nr:hypothetical protein [Cyclobacterium lianum]SHM78732.1 hypothetical protein SAMN04488057_103325 [Cyclobacterium lianum]